MNCDGTIEDWETSSEAPRVIFGIIGTAHTALYMYLYFADSYAANNGFSFATMYTSTRSMALLLALIFSITEAVMWAISYAEVTVIT